MNLEKQHKENPQARFSFLPKLQIKQSRVAVIFTMWNQPAENLIKLRKPRPMKLFFFSYCKHSQTSYVFVKPCLQACLHQIGQNYNKIQKDKR